MRESTQKKHDNVLGMYQQGCTLKKIARETGYKESSVKEIIQKAGKRMPVKPQKRIKPELDKIIRMRNEGKTLTEIKAETGFAICSISKALNEAGHGKYVMHNVNAKNIDESKLTYAKPRTIPQAQVKAGGRTYTDVTGLYIGI